MLGILRIFYLLHSHVRIPIPIGLIHYKSWRLNQKSLLMTLVTRYEESRQTSWMSLWKSMNPLCIQFGNTTRDTPYHFHILSSWSSIPIVLYDSHTTSSFPKYYRFYMFQTVYIMQFRRLNSWWQLWYPKDSRNKDSDDKFSSGSRQITSFIPNLVLQTPFWC